MKQQCSNYFSSTVRIYFMFLVFDKSAICKFFQTNDGTATTDFYTCTVVLLAQQTRRGFLLEYANNGTVTMNVQSAKKRNSRRKDSSGPGDSSCVRNTWRSFWYGTGLCGMRRNTVLLLVFVVTLVIFVSSGRRGGVLSLFSVSKYGYTDSDIHTTLAISQHLVKFISGICLTFSAHIGSLRFFFL